jgi:hypothetical protein
MYRFAVCIISAGLVFAPAIVRAQEAEAPKARTFQFQKKQPAAGDVSTAQQRMVLKLDFVLSGPDIEPTPIKTSSTSVSHYSTTVLAARKGIVDRVKLAFSEMYDDEVGEEGKTERKAGPASGKTYLASWEKGRVVVTDEAGKPISQEEREAIQGSLPKLGKPDPVEAALPETPLRVGDSLDRFAKVFEKEVLTSSSAGSVRFGKTRIRLAEIVQDARGDVGVFSMSTTMTLQDAEAPFVMIVPMEGKISFRAKGARVLEFSLGGPARMEILQAMRAAGLTVEGSGETRLHLVDPTET